MKREFNTNQSHKPTRGIIVLKQKKSHPHILNPFFPFFIPFSHHSKRGRSLVLIFFLCFWIQPKHRDKIGKESNAKAYLAFAMFPNIATSEMIADPVLRVYCFPSTGVVVPFDRDML
jgi:hypothetical protein